MHISNPSLARTCSSRSLRTSHAPEISALSCQPATLSASNHHVEQSGLYRVSGASSLHLAESELGAGSRTSLWRCVSRED